ncbi:tRNA dihydrouridine synthase DusB [Syntrophomonas palmitatica]|uniref:tRNA dihydrouridine synthase DusB n=1 Tax=Syntrophomonas palmitatica TaxID=402877 RepID=UPI0006D12810|nr:tRNA dihydrouridine synthase DusB [Syntrophomonas palmitatica]
MLSIGSLQLKNQVFSAPMAGVTDRAFRDMAREYGCGLVYTEMISDMGLFYRQERTLRMADVRTEPAPVAVQIFGSDPDTVSKGAVLLQELGASLIDINMGCPTPKVVKNGEGAALMLDLPRAARIIRATVKAVSVPVTIKMRKGWNQGDSTYLELARIAENEGARAVALHGRSRQEFFSGQADWQAIADLKNAIKIPVIGNGDIWSADDARRMIEETSCDAVMIGRGAFGNPFIFRETVALLQDRCRLENPNLEERIAAAARHLELACRYKGEAVAVREMRKHFSWYTRGLRGAARIRHDINQAVTCEEIMAALRECYRLSE